jgi:hypothetical protein
MGIFKEVGKGLGGIAGEVIRQATGAKQQKKKEYRNINRYSVDELTRISKHHQDVLKDVWKKK